MTIITKYDLLQTVWLMRGNKAIETTIMAITTHRVHDNSGKSLVGHDSNEYITSMLSESVQEEDLFATKEDLLKSL